MLGDIQEFNAKFGIRSLSRPGFLEDGDMKQRLDFQFEELLETAQASGFYFNSDQMEFKWAWNNLIQKNLPEILDGIVDQMYVLMGTAVKMGFFAPIGVGGHTVFGEAWDRVHAANMEKEMVPGMWKVQKPEGWQRPELGDLCK